MWRKRRVCVGEQGWRDGEVEKETEVFGCMCVCVCVCVCGERDMLWLFMRMCVRETGVCVCVCVERLGSMGIQR